MIKSKPSLFEILCSTFAIQIMFSRIRISDSFIENRQIFKAINYYNFTMTLKEQLERIVGPQNVFDDQEILLKYLKDQSFVSQIQHLILS